MNRAPRVLLIAMMALLAAALVVVPAEPASAQTSVLASALTPTGSTNLLSFTDDPAVPFSSPGDGFNVFQRNVSASIPFSLADDSAVGFPGDTLGIITEADLDQFFGATDTVNADTTGPVSATWLFDISSGTNLVLSLDIGAMGDFELDDTFEWSYSIDGAAPVSALALTVDENASRNYPLAGGALITLDDPINAGAVELSNTLQTISIPLVGSGGNLALTFTAETNGGSEALAFRNIVITSDGEPGGGPNPGDLVITEIMQNPAAVNDDMGEWFELHNTSAVDIDIDGWTISDRDSDSHLIIDGAGVIVPAGGYAVLGNNGESLLNGGVTVNYVYAGIALANGGDELVITDPGGVEFDAVEYDGGPAFPDPTGASMSLNPLFTNTLDNDTGANWCQGSTTYGVGDLGSPGAVNPECVEPPVETVLIHEIQGSGPLVAITAPIMVEAVVTSLFERDDVLDGFFVQEEDADADADAATSEGIFVYCRGNCPAVLSVGDLVEVAGTPTDFFGMSQVDMTAGSVTVVSSGNALPTPAALTLPAAGATNAEGTFENLEGMVVTISSTLAVSEYFQLARFGQLVLTDTARPFQYTHLNPPSVAGYGAFLADLATRRIILDDDNNDNNDPISDGPDEVYPYPDGGLSTSNKFRGGDTVTGLTGVLHWSFAGSSGTDAWRVRPIDGVVNTFSSVNPAPFSPPAVGGSLTVASFNVLNYFATVDGGPDICGPAADQDCRGADSAAELVRQRDKIVAAIAAMNADVVGLIELQNDADASIVELISALNALLGAGTYDYVDTGFIGDDAIKVGYIYQPATVVPAGDFAILDSSVDPTFLDTKNRPALIQTFDEVATGARFTVAVNHLKSKGSPCDDVGDPGLGDGQANCSQTRAAAAAALATYLATDPTGSEDPDFLIIGDLNAYAMEDAVTALTSAGYTDLLNFFGGSGAYSYVFDGQLGYLDHGLANSDLLSQVTGTSAWLINADEIPIFDYNDDVADPGEQSFERESGVASTYSADPFRSSDHDPVIIGLQLDPPVYECNGLLATIVGTPGNDRIRGTNGPDVIVALGGNDRIDGRNGDDVICAGPGFDQIIGGNGRDYIDGGDGTDFAWGGRGRDTLIGGEGVDDLSGGRGRDIIEGGEGNDFLRGGRGNDTLNGGPGTDRLTGGNGRDTCTEGEVLASCEL